MLSLDAYDCTPVIGPVADSSPASYGLFVRKQEGG